MVGGVPPGLYSDIIYFRQHVNTLGYLGFFCCCFIMIRWAISNEGSVED